MLLRFIRFDNDVTHPECLLADKAAAIRDIWTMFISNLNKNYKPRECITSTNSYMDIVGGLALLNVCHQNLKSTA
ncbi:unnamed protein product [Parnassius apollo]|uniref:(apollo) hypothetical protein n=1 Tax=Parnassius apollo TaxID=110799 RepID=A0A8S3WH76_PARAO|nr:unnamed protein product [Parnassius apollo]